MKAPFGNIANALVQPIACGDCVFSARFFSALFRTVYLGCESAPRNCPMEAQHLQVGIDLCPDQHGFTYSWRRPLFADLGFPKLASGYRKWAWPPAFAVQFHGCVRRKRLGKRSSELMGDSRVARTSWGLLDGSGDSLTGEGWSDADIRISLRRLRRALRAYRDEWQDQGHLPEV